MHARFLVVTSALLVLVGGCDTPDDDEEDGISSMQLVTDAPDLPRVPLDPSAAARLRVATYNIHSGLGSGWLPVATRATVESNLRAIAATIAAVGPASEPVDVVALNEVDFDARRTARVDEATFIARELSARTGARYSVVPIVTWVVRFPLFHIRFGSALLTRHRVLSVETHMLDGSEPGDDPLPPLAADSSTPRAEPRGVVRARLEIEGRPVDVLVTHLEAHYPRLREAQAVHILKRFVEPGVPTILAGDMNAEPEQLAPDGRLAAADRTDTVLGSGPLIDATTFATVRAGTRDPARWSTYPADRPVRAIDHVLATPDLMLVDLATFDAGVSDHRGLAAVYAPSSPAQRSALEAWRDALRRSRLDRVLALASTHPVAGATASFLAHGTRLLDVAAPGDRARVLEAVSPTRTASLAPGAPPGGGGTAGGGIGEPPLAP